MSDTLDLFAFYANQQRLSELVENDIHGVVVDWERKGKELRQKLYDTQISTHDHTDLVQVRERFSNQIICRINAVHAGSQQEVEQVLQCGADEILIPMVTSVQEVEQILKYAEGKIKVGLMLETEEAIAMAAEFDQLPVHRFFVGLNDLSIQRGSRNIFLPFIDGTLDELRPKITKHFGVGGLTHPELGNPIPCRYLINRMKHYQCTYAFLRRSFYRDLDQYAMGEILGALSDTFKEELKEGEWTEEMDALFRQELI